MKSFSIFSYQGENYLIHINELQNLQTNSPIISKLLD